MCYVGRRVECLRDIDIFILAFFIFFQARVAVAMDRKAILYKGGIKGAQVVDSSTTVECLVELTKYDRAVDMIARANKNGQRHALKLLQEVNDILVQVLEEKRPGSLSRQFLLHVPHIKEGQLEPFGFPEEEVEGAKANGKEVVIVVDGYQHMTGSLRDLMAIELQDTSTMCSLAFHTTKLLTVCFCCIRI